MKYRNHVEFSNFCILDQVHALHCDDNFVVNSNLYSCRMPCVILGKGKRKVGERSSRNEPKKPTDPTKNYIVERGIIIPNQLDPTYDSIPWDELNRCALRNGWANFFGDLGSWDLDLCDEFYDALVEWKDATPRSYNIKIRGVWVTFSTSAIRKYFEVRQKKPHDGQASMVYDSGVVPIPHHMVEFLCNPGVEVQGDIFYIRSHDLNPFAKFVLKFVMYSLTPITGDTSLRVLQASAIYHMLTGGFIELGSTILLGILDHVGHSPIRVFPCLITGLCEKAGVPNICRRFRPYGPLTQYIWSFMGNLRMKSQVGENDEEHVTWAGVDERIGNRLSQHLQAMKIRNDKFLGHVDKKFDAFTATTTAQWDEVAAYWNGTRVDMEEQEATMNKLSAHMELSQKYMAQTQEFMGVQQHYMGAHPHIWPPPPPPPSDDPMQ